MITLSAQKIAEILEYHQQVIEAEITEVSTDSRKVDAHTLFIALKGEKFDGHDFIVEVLAKGAPLVVTERLIEGIDNTRQIVVKDTLKALGKLAQYNRRQYKGTLIALTGSSGKTTTKEELKAALQLFAPTYATTGNFNNFIGVPRSLLDIDMNSAYAVIEMGMSALGEIAYLTSLAEPDIAIVTNVYSMHMEFLGSLENIAHAKAEIFSGLKPQGIAIFNEDAAFADILRTEALKYAGQVVTYGQSHHPVAQLRLEDDALHFNYNAWCVLQTVQTLGLDVDTAVEAVNAFSAPEGRGKKYQLILNGSHITLIDNSYSGGPEATVLAVNSLGKMKTVGRKIAVIGKMAELGDYTKDAHINVGQALRDNHIDVVIGVCEETKDMLAQLAPTAEQYFFPTVDGVENFLRTAVLKEGDALLIKGSHYSSQVYKVAAALKSYAV